MNTEVDDVQLKKKLHVSQQNAQHFIPVNQLNRLLVKIKVQLGTLQFPHICKSSNNHIKASTQVILR